MAPLLHLKIALCVSFLVLLLGAAASKVVNLDSKLNLHTPAQRFCSDDGDAVDAQLILLQTQMRVNKPVASQESQILSQILPVDESSELVGDGSPTLFQANVELGSMADATGYNLINHAGTEHYAHNAQGDVPADGEGIHKASSLLLEDAAELEALLPPPRTYSRDDIEQIAPGLLEQLVPMASTASPLNVGDRVMAVVPHADWAHPLKAGVTGTVREIVSDGRALVEFDGNPQIQGKMLREEVQKLNKLEAIQNASISSRIEAVATTLTKSMAAKFGIAAGVLIVLCCCCCLGPLIWSRNVDAERFEDAELNEAWVRFPKT